MEFRALADKLTQGLNKVIIGEPHTGPIHRNLQAQFGDRNRVKVDVVEPIGDGPHPVMVFVHGGGWVAGDLNGYHQMVRRFAEQGFVVVAVEYRLAPESPFPSGYDDCVTAVRWTIANIARFGGDPDRVVIAGDSSGANLAAAVAVSEPALPIKVAALFYGVFDIRDVPTSPEVHAEGFTDELRRSYLGESHLHLLEDPRVSPIYGAGRLPPTIIAVGTADPAYGQSMLLAEALLEAEVEHDLLVVQDYPHAFLQVETLPETLPTFRAIASLLAKRCERATFAGDSHIPEESARVSGW